MTSSWEKFSDSESPVSPVSAVACDSSSRHSPLATAAAAGGSDVGKDNKGAEVDSPVSTDDVRPSVVVYVGYYVRYVQIQIIFLAKSSNVLNLASVLSLGLCI